MKTFLTKFTTIDEFGELVCFEGERVFSPSFSLAEDYCKKHAPHLTVVGEIVSIIPTKKDGITPDWDKEINYEIPNLN